jgi:uracil-DNA glycosylase family 4
MGIPIWVERNPTAHPATEPDASLPEPEVSPTIQADHSATSAEVVPVTDTAHVEPQPEVVAERSPAEPLIDITSMNWEELRQTVSDCHACTLATGRTQTVFGVGDQNADWMVIGEGPGAEEDKQGEPFVGRAGQLLNKMLAAIGLRREQVYIANIVKCRPPQNRDPLPEESVACSAYLKRQIELVQPKVILVLGKVAAQNLLQKEDTLGRLRGAPYLYADTGIPVIVTYHPAYLLRKPTDKRKAWEDLKLAVKLVGGGA